MGFSPWGKWENPEVGLEGFGTKLAEPRPNGPVTSVHWVKGPPSNIIELSY